MAIIQLNDFRSMTEFGAYNGDCFFAAVLPLLHCIDEDAFPLNLATLNTLVTEAHAGGFCEASGAINVPNASRWLSQLAWTDHFGTQRKGVAHSTFCSYGTKLDGDTSTWHPFVVEAFIKDASGKTVLDPGCFHAVLKAAAGTLGIVWERSAGAPLPGDELGVVFHYGATGGVDEGATVNGISGIGGAYLCADGDNSANPRSGAPIAAIRYTWAQIAAANPIGAIRINQTPIYNPGATPVAAPVVQPASTPVAAPVVVAAGARTYTLTIAADGTATIKAN